MVICFLRFCHRVHESNRSTFMPLRKEPVDLLTKCLFLASTIPRFFHFFFLRLYFCRIYFSKVALHCYVNKYVCLLLNSVCVIEHGCATACHEVLKVKSLRKFKLLYTTLNCKEHMNSSHSC